MIRTSSFLPLLVGAVLLAAMASERLRAAEPVTPPAKLDIDRAIDAVYPALVQIYVLSPGYDNGRERKYQSAGSGAIISKDGHVITNHHVAGHAVAIRCILSTKEELDATLVGTDPLADIAVIKLDLAGRQPGAPLPVAHFGSSEELRIGDTVLAMGCPLALSQSVTRGIVSNKDMTIPKFMGGELEMDGENVGTVVKWIGHDAHIDHGNSGGPLVNIEGGIVGINEIGLGLAGAIPSELARSVAEQLIAHGKIARAWLGIGFQPLLKPGTGEKPGDGVLVSSVVPGSPAEGAGVLAGDTVMAVDAQAVTVRFDTQLPGFTQLLLAKKVGVPVALRITRAGKELSLMVTPIARDEARGKEAEVKEWGLTVRRLTLLESKERLRADQKGVVVGSVRPGGPANRAIPDLREDDLILEIAGEAVDGLESFQALTAAVVKDHADPVPTLVAYERGAERELTVVEIGIRKPQEPPAVARKPWLPVATQVLSSKLATALGLKGKKGVRITQVYPDSSAQEAGLQVGDVLTRIDDQAIEASEPQDAQVFEQMLRAYKPDARVEFTVIRDGKPLVIGLVLTEAPRQEAELKVYEDVALEFKARDISYLDRVKHRWQKNERGALVTQVESGGWAAVGGLHTDDLVQAVDGEPVADIKALETHLKPLIDKHAKHLTLFVKRGISTTFIELEPTWPAP